MEPLEPILQLAILMENQASLCVGSLPYQPMKLLMLRLGGKTRRASLRLYSHCCFRRYFVFNSEYQQLLIEYNNETTFNRNYSSQDNLRR